MRHGNMEPQTSTVNFILSVGLPTPDGRLTLRMKLLTVYDVLKDHSFLVEVVSGEETLDALKAAVQERGVAAYFSRYIN
jgi:hypothetical protein